MKALGHLNNQMQLDRERTESKLEKARAERALKPRVSRKLPTDDMENDRMSQRSTPVKAGKAGSEVFMSLNKDDTPSKPKALSRGRRSLFLLFLLIVLLCCLLAGGLLYVRNSNLKTKPRRKLPFIC